MKEYPGYKGNEASHWHFRRYGKRDILSMGMRGRRHLLFSVTAYSMNMHDLEPGDRALLFEATVRAMQTGEELPLEHKRFSYWWPTREPIAAKDRRAVLAVGRCAHCASTHKLQVDHIKPVCRGGGSERRNLQPLCWPCNRKKGGS